MEFEKVLTKIAKELKRNKIDYMVIGGQAVLIYGALRFTRDIDITLGLNTDRLNDILKIAKSLRLKLLVKDVADFVKKTYVLPLMNGKSKIRVDFIFSWSSYEREALKRVKKVKIGKTKVNFANVEDVIIHKIIAGRERDLEDVKSILIKKEEVDEEYIKKWLLEFEKVIEERFFEKFLKVKKVAWI